MDTRPYLPTYKYIYRSPLGRFSTSIGCKCLCDSKNIKNIFLGSHKNAFVLLSGWSYAPRYSCRSKAKVNCFLHTKKRYASKTAMLLLVIDF